jgi:hypothetical protein
MVMDARDDEGVTDQADRGGPDDHSDGRHLEAPEAPGCYALCFKRETFDRVNARVLPLPLAAESSYFRCSPGQAKDIESRFANLETPC